MRIEPYEQRQNGTCGQASLLMAYRHFEERIDEDALVSEMKPWLGILDSKYLGGTQHEQMVEGIKRHGLTAKYQINSFYGELMEVSQKTPVIVEWMTDCNMAAESDCHYSVVVSADEDKIRLADPTYGRITTIGREDWMRKWMGFEKDGSITKRMSLAIYEP